MRTHPLYDAHLKEIAELELAEIRKVLNAPDLSDADVRSLIADILAAGEVERTNVWRLAPIGTHRGFAAPANDTAPPRTMADWQFLVPLTMAVGLICFGSGIMVWGLMQ